MTTNHLTPETRVNKHGVPVIKHVRSQPKGKDSSPNRFPAPSHKPTAKQLINQIADALPAWGSPGRFIDRLEDLHRDNPELFMQAASVIVQSDEEGLGLWRYAFSKWDSSDERYIRRMIEIIPLSVVLYPDAPPGFRISKITDRATEAEYRIPCEPGYENYTRVKAEMIISEIGQEQIHPFDRQDMIDYIASNMESVQKIIPHLMERKDTSVALMRTLLENDTSALNEGVL